MPLNYQLTRLFVSIVLGIAVIHISLYQAGCYGNSSRANPMKYCQANLKQIQAYKSMWSMDHPEQAAKGISPSIPDMVPEYLKALPRCPAGGSYTPGDTAHRPNCTVHGTVPELPDH
jgi:hypothetical protein